jgi:hypothetical protein
MGMPGKVTAQGSAVRSADARRAPLTVALNGKRIVGTVGRATRAGQTSRGAGDRVMVVYLIERQTERFTSGEDLPHIQVMIDEAHNLFSSNRFKNEFDPWVRLAMEGRKLRIGVLYAAQDVARVDRRVLANTQNWVGASPTTVLKRPSARRRGFTPRER